MRLNWWDKFISLESSESVDVKRKLLVLNACTYIGGSIIFYFGFNAPFETQALLKISLLIGAVFLFLNVFLLHWHQRLTLSLSLYAIVSVPFFLSIVYTGGYENTGLYWTFLVPITLFVFFGYFRGLILNLIIFTGIVLMLCYPEHVIADYRSEEVSRYIASYIVNIAFCLINEYFRFRSHEELAVINFEKQRQANSDALTELPNRRFIESIFFQTVATQPNHYFPMMFVALDIDHFKSVNDNYGHDVGDEVLKHLANILKTNTRDTDIVARTGGEEFLIVFPKTELDLGLQIADKLRCIIGANAHKSAYAKSDEGITVTVSMGCAGFECPQEVGMALKQADELLYQAKNNGRNRLESTLQRSCS